MRIIRYEDKQGHVGYAAQLNDGEAMKLRGDLTGERRLRHAQPLSSAALMLLLADSHKIAQLRISISIPYRYQFDSKDVLDA